ncbi:MULTISPECIES: squalene--hopene cyclase [Aphanothece]|uniref:squalene--hopene cyclase n=1 Tax=Aphanothece TaxID=1121 RepID=UPI00398E5B53
MQDIITPSALHRTIQASQNHLLSIQHSDGYWWSELESNVTMTAEAVLLHRIWNSGDSRPLHKAEPYLRAQQREHGGWELFHGDGGDLSTSVEAYMALRLLGVAAGDPALVAAKTFILSRGGIERCRIFTKLHLALIGCYPWAGVPSIPAWVMLFPTWFPFTIYELSSWARGSTVPLLIVFDQKPVFQMNPSIQLDELYADPRARSRPSLPRSGGLGDVFVLLDSVFKLMERLRLVPFRRRGLRAAERWMLERQETSGDWGGIIPAMLNSLLALRCLDYDVHDPIVVRGLEAVDRFTIETADQWRVQPCVSPVWDTALAMRALRASGLAAQHPALVRGGEWLLGKQILDYGDWAIKNRRGQPGAWAFEFENRFYPDVDDTAVVVMALATVSLADEGLRQQAMRRGVAWILTMQCRQGGWAAFDLNNNQNWLNALPYADLKAMIDPNTADVTARVLEMLGRLGHRSPGSAASPAIERALAYLLGEQEAEGCWFGRWGVNYIYGTSGALAALAAIAPDRAAGAIARGARWLLGCQNADGGWGESCRSYGDPLLKGVGLSTASQTAWAMIGLLACAGLDTAHAAEVRDALGRAASYLVSSQGADGTWEEAEFTGTGFPGHFYLKYHLYQQHFPLTALSGYAALGDAVPSS